MASKSELFRAMAALASAALTLLLVAVSLLLVIPSLVVASGPSPHSALVMALDLPISATASTPRKLGPGDADSSPLSIEQPISGCVSSHPALALFQKNVLSPLGLWGCSHVENSAPSIMLPSVSTGMSGSTESPPEGGVLALPREEQPTSLAVPAIKAVGGSLRQKAAELKKLLAFIWEEDPALEEDTAATSADKPNQARPTGLSWDMYFAEVGI